MRLAQLIYKISRNIMQTTPDGFSFNAFIQGDFDTDPDYSSQIAFAFDYANLAFQRLYTARKTKLKSALRFPITGTGGFLPFEEGEVTAVYRFSPDGGYVTYPFKPFRALGKRGVAVDRAALICDREGKSIPLWVEYRPYIPHFDIEDIRQEGLDPINELETIEKEVDLEQYGLTDEMCAYVAEYAEGMLMENASPELSARHVNMAEAYFTGLKTEHTEFPQPRVSGKWGL